MLVHSLRYLFLFALLGFSLSACKEQVIVSPEDLRQETDSKTDKIQWIITTNNPSSSATATLRSLGMKSGESIKIF